MGIGKRLRDMVGAAIGSNTYENRIADLLDDVDDALVGFDTEWFNNEINKDTTLAPTPGTADADAMSRNGRIGVAQNCTISYAHFHYDHPAGTGQFDMELWRERESVLTLIANSSDDGTGGNFGRTSFTFVSEALKSMESGDYLLLQATAVMTGSGAKNASAFVDVHFTSQTLRTMRLNQ